MHYLTDFLEQISTYQNWVTQK